MSSGDANGTPLRVPDRCPSCGEIRFGDRCSECGYESPPPQLDKDPLVGRTIADRYEISSLINVGGMGRVYRANQRSLGREVAIKFIHPHLASSDLSVQRFLTEARAASRLNHPHVVSIFDFGRTAEAEGGLLFLVMELLSGPDLVATIRREGPLPFARLAMILGQTLEALGEAHRLGITHRDIKPGNIMLMPRRKGRDHVKVIDFGTAKMQATGRITQTGSVCGTPVYMAPEQGSGGALGPWTDIYSVGVMMFEMLTGKLPFVGKAAAAVLLQHMTAARPDPRAVAPERNIPASMAEVCLQALEIDPMRRFESAEDFGETLALCAHSAELGSSFRWKTTDSLVSKGGPSVADSDPPPMRRDSRAEIDTMPDLHRMSAGSIPVPRLPKVTPSIAPVPLEDPTFIGRERDLAWARELVARPDGPSAIAFWGRSGTGRTRLLKEISGLGEREGAVLIRVPLAPSPRCLVGYLGLRAMITRLSGQTANDLLSDRVSGMIPAPVRIGLRAIFGETLGRLPVDPTVVRMGVAAAFGWSVEGAIERSDHGRVLLAIDDLEHLDGVSLLALEDLLQGEPIVGFTVLMTGAKSPGGAFDDRVWARTIRGLSRTQAIRMLASRRDPAVLVRSDDDIEPLYVEQIARLKPSYEQTAPPALADLLAWRVQGLPPAMGRLLQAVAVTGGGTTAQLGRVMRRPDETEAALQPLVDGGFVQMSERGITLTHEVFGIAAIAVAPGGAISELHEAAGEVLAEQRASIELRAHHAIRGRPDFQAFVLVEETAKLRTMRGDRRGTIAVLDEAIAAARSHYMRKELELAPAVWSIFGRKLATALAEEGRSEDATEVLLEVLEIAPPGDRSRAQVLEQLAAIAESRGEADEARKWRSEALEVAEQCGDIDMAEGLRAFLAEAGGMPVSRA